MALSIVIILSYIYFFVGWDNNIYLLIAWALGLYMAINIWANDVANNMWPAVWSKALTITWAIIIAAIFEAGWAIIAGWDVVNTIKWWIIDASQITETKSFIAIMLATLFGAALWINIATFFKAPVSATHSILWGLVGAWIVAGVMNIIQNSYEYTIWQALTWGINMVDWSQIWTIAASWVISPLMWGIIAILLVISIKKTILGTDERWENAKKWVPVYVWLMSWVFSIYLALKWLKPLLKSNDTLAHIITPTSAVFTWILIALGVYAGLIYYYKHQSSYFKDSKRFINSLFNIPLIFSVALLSFAHGANDVANAIGPLAAIKDAIAADWGFVSITNIIGKDSSVPTWIMILGAAGLVIGLSVFGSRLINTVGWEITKLNQIRAFCVALSAAITVIIASQLGLPVSSTHIALGGIFGVGLLKEYNKRMHGHDKDYIQKGMIKSIALAWIITLPISAIISWITYIFIMAL